VSAPFTSVVNPLTVCQARVFDVDMNLSPATREKSGVATTARSRVVRNVVRNPYVAATSGAATATDWHRAGTDIEAGRATVDLLDANEASWAFSRGPTWLIPGSRRSTALAVLGAESCGKLWQGPVRDRAEDRPLGSKPVTRKTHDLRRTQRGPGGNGGQSDSPTTIRRSRPAR
jgi:hypothetical protein